MRVEQLDAGDGVKLALTLVQHDLDVRERLQPGAEARLGLADPLGHGADATALEAVEMEHTIGLAQPERA